jgi:hypothetical protein
MAPLQPGGSLTLRKRNALVDKRQLFFKPRADKAPGGITVLAGLRQMTIGAVHMFLQPFIHGFGPQDRNQRGFIVILVRIFTVSA